MAKIRSRNEGSVFQRPDGKWRAQVSIDGRRLSFLADTKKEGLAWILETKNQIVSGLTFQATGTTLEEFLGEWLTTVSSSNSKGTYFSYSWTVQKRILPYIGNVNLMDLRPDRIQRFYNFLQKEERLSHHAVAVTHKTLRVAMNHAVKLRLIGRNPCSGTTPPKPEQTEMKFYDDREVKSLLKTARDIVDKYYPLYYLAIHTGMRQAELIGLKWEDIDWSLRTLQVKRQVRHFTGASYAFLEPKSRSGTRTIMLGKQALEILRSHKREQEELINSVGQGWTDLDLVFPSGVGTPLTASNIRRDFRQLLTASGLPKIRFHDLRHTAASLMLNHGIPVLIASKRLGHSKPSITLDVYGHLIPSKQEEAAQLMDDLMFEG
jgi:integrase